MKLLYDWHEYPDIIILLIAVSANTQTVLELKHKDISYANEVVNDIEEYLMYMKTHNYDLSLIVNKLKSVLYIDFFKQKKKIDNGIFYLTDEFVVNIDEVIFLSENIHEDKRLSQNERRRLYLYKGLSRIILDFDNEKTADFNKLYSDLFPNKKDTELLVKSGWLLLKETLSQELAEKITYESLNKDRPGLRPGIENQDLFPIDGSKVSSRLELYRPFEYLTVLFGATISGVGKMWDYSDTTIMNDLLYKALNVNLSDAAISEYIFNNNELELYIILYYMGLLMNEKYATYGKRIVNNVIMEIDDINKIYDKLIDLLGGLFNLNDDEFSDIPLKEVSKNIFVKERIKKIINNS